MAAVILAAIFVPFQKAEAFTAELDLPDDDPDNVPQSTEGSTFLVTIDIAPGELISLNQIELILDNGTPQVKRAIFDADGDHISGAPDLTIGDLEVDIPTATLSGYGYGFGTVSNGTSFAPPYSYSFSSSQDFLSSNSYGYSYAVPNANLINGFVGPATITIEGKLNTADMSLGSHTLDVLVHTGSGGNGVDEIVPPQLAFTVTQAPPPPPPTSAPDAIRALIIKAEGMGANANMLKQAPKLLEDGNPNNDVAACGKLGAFVNHTEAQAGKSLTHEQAEELTGDASDIEGLLECGSDAHDSGDDNDANNNQQSDEEDDNSNKGKGKDKEKQDNGKHKGQEKNKNKGKK